MATAPPLFTVARPAHEDSASALMAQIMRASESVKKNPLQIAGDYLRVAIGPGRISPDDFIRLRLFDESWYRGADRSEFVGARSYRGICAAINTYRGDWLCMLTNKVASMSYLGAYGLRTIPIKGIYMPRARSDDPGILCDTKALEQFLLRPELYPLFGKPIESLNSLGSVALTACSPSEGRVSTSEGAQVRAADLAAEIDAHYPEGYLLQECTMPHPAIEALCGKRLATVRFLTVADEDGAQILRACWKIPAGSNAADNYWRSGNLLAQVDLSSGTILRVTSGAGLEMREHSAHPDTKASLVGSVHPQWQEMKALATEGARLMRNVPLIGWDIACTDKGPFIVEMNEHPDSFLVQFADRRGLLDDTFKKFIEFQKRNRDAYRRIRRGSEARKSGAMI